MEISVMSDYEQRYSDGFSIREDNGTTWVSGLAVPFFDGTRATEYELAPGYFERVSPNVVCNLDDVEACIMHERNRLIGMTPETLKLNRTAKGIEYSILLDDSTDSKDAKIMVANRKLKGASIRFMPTETKVEGKNITIEAMRLDHVALVSRPAYKTSAYLRMIETDKEKELMNIYEKRLSQVIASLAPSGDKVTK